MQSSLKTTGTEGEQTPWFDIVGSTSCFWPHRCNMRERKMFRA